MCVIAPTQNTIRKQNVVKIGKTKKYNGFQSHRWLIQDHKHFTAQAATQQSCNVRTLRLMIWQIWAWRSDDGELNEG